METREQIEKFKEFFEKSYLTELNKISREQRKSFNVDFRELEIEEPELSEEILKQPEEVIKAAELSLDDLNIPDKNLRIRLFNLPKAAEIKIRNIRSIDLGRFLSFDGIVRQSSDVRPQVTNARFECPSCGNVISILQMDQKFKEPSRCTCGRRGQFRMISKDLVDAQRLVLEEPPETLEGGEQPKRLSVFLKEDLVEPHMERKTTPGSKIKVSGVVKEVPIQLKTGAQSIRYDIAADAIHVEPIEQTYEDIEVTEEDKEKIHELAKDPALFDRLVNSICPSVYGYADTKEALVLQLAGGVKRERPDGTKLRGDVHILLVGDPGAAKSTMLTFMEKAAPKARYVAGRSTSGAGITATVVKDEFLRGWALEAGAVVLANKGLLLIDEMDKMSIEDTSALHEAMAQQQVTISKANIQACYSEDTEVLTENGWKHYSQIRSSEKIAQFDPKQKTITFLNHKGLYVYKYKGKMYHFKNKRIDILVTPNHKMLVKESRQKYFKGINAEDITYSRIQVTNTGTFIGNETTYFTLPAIKHKQNRTHPKYTHQHVEKKIPMNLWVEFLGYYLSEGGIQAKPTIGIPQKSKAHVKKIRTCLQKLAKIVGFTLSETKEGVYTRFQITNTQLFTCLAETCGHNCYTKKLPLTLSELSKTQLKILYDALMLGDGTSDGKSLNSTSKELIDIFQAITCLIGKSASQHVHYAEGYRKNKKKTYRVTISNRTTMTIKKSQVAKPNYNGKVYCFATQTGYFVTRRNGKIAIQGNTLRAQTSILAAANPKLGRFDPFQPIAQQIDLPPALINRFDLIFPVRDLPSKEVDEKIALHILEQDFKGKAPEIPTDFMKKYVSYCKHIDPKLTKQAIQEIKNFYVGLRNSGGPSEGKIKPIPISARQLESIIRLAEASARIRLSEQVTQADAQRAIRLVTFCLTQVGIDPETGQIDIDRISTGITANQRSRISVIREIIDHLEKKVGKSIPIEDIVTEAGEKGLSESQVEEVIERFKREGYIFEPKRGQLSKL